MAEAPLTAAGKIERGTAPAAALRMGAAATIELDTASAGMPEEAVEVQIEQDIASAGAQRTADTKIGRGTAPAAAAGETIHSGHWPAGAVGNRRIWLPTAPALIPQRALRQARPVGRRYDAWNPAARSGLAHHRGSPG